MQWLYEALPYSLRKRQTEKPSLFTYVWEGSLEYFGPFFFIRKYMTGAFCVEDPKSLFDKIVNSK